MVTNWLGYPPFYQAFGIRETRYQWNYQVAKNVGLFFVGKLEQEYMWAEMEDYVDDLWITGPDPWHGACDPTYSFGWVVRQLLDNYPEADTAHPICIGFGWLPYAGIYDAELKRGNIAHVKP